jgi:8-oxo-dGTP diphosphatase
MVDHDRLRKLGRVAVRGQVGQCVCDLGVPAVDGMQVAIRRSRGRMAEPTHQILDRRASRRREGLAGVPQVVMPEPGHASLQPRAVERLANRVTAHRAAIPTELGETIQDGLRREVREETGLDVEPVALTGVYKNMTRGIIALVFRCKISGGDLRASDETTAFRWATEADIAELADQAYAVRILDALHDEHPPAIRQHDGVHLL